jgi:hypothetical protein
VSPRPVDRDDLARYQLLASAVACKPVTIATVGTGELPFTDAESLHLGPHRDHDVHLVELAVQASLIAAGSLSRDAMRRLYGRPAAARRYLALEGRRALDALADTAPGLSARTARLRAGLPLSHSAEESLSRAFAREAVPDPPPGFGVLRPQQVLAALDRADERAAAARRGPQAGPVEVSRSEDGAEQELDENVIEAGFLRFFKKLLGVEDDEEARTAAREARSGHLVHRPGSAAPPGARRVVFARPPRLPDEEPPDGHGGHIYPEWDGARRRFRRAWCTVFERDIPPNERRPLDRPPRDDALRRHLSPLGVGLERRRRQIQGEDLDVDALVESRVQVAARSTPDENVYIEAQRRRRDLAVLVLLDVSGSTGDPSPFGATVHDRQRAAAGQLIDTLNVLGDRVAAYGFRSRGRKAVEMLRVKTFDEPLDGLIFERLGGLTPTAFTRMGAAIRHATSLIEARAGASRRLLVVLSDGLAYDDGYERGYGDADTRHALAETRENGIGCLCISLGGGTDAGALRRVFGSSAHASAPALEDLRDDIGLLFRRAILSAESRRRLARRASRARDLRARAGARASRASFAGT